MRSRFLKPSCAAMVPITGSLFFLYGRQPNPDFTGGKVTKLDDKSSTTVAHFRFGPGSRTKWHSHSGGQIILVEEGVGLTQVKGGVHYNVTRGDIAWLDEVTDAEYKTKPKR
jgi:quercetin dioxygenase-like cupin family protein